MRNAQKAAFGVLTLLLATGAIAVSSGAALAASGGGSSPTAVVAKKRCNKGFVTKIVRHRQRCVKKRRPPTAPKPAAPIVPGPPAAAPTPPTPPTATAPAPPAPPPPAWDDGRWRGFYSEDGSVDLLFNVLAGRLYTGGFDSFFINAACSDGSFDPSAISPVQASIASNGDFAGSGVYSPGFGMQIPWHLSGHISRRSITGGVFTVDPYTDFFGDSCGGTTHFTGQWIAAYTL
jgi:hypothetical protein